MVICTAPSSTAYVNRLIGSVGEFLKYLVPPPLLKLHLDMLRGLRGLKAQLRSLSIFFSKDKRYLLPDHFLHVLLYLFSFAYTTVRRNEE